jgi:hypothetical protein
MKRWKKKYFVLDSFLLRYYHDQKDIKAGNAPNGIITLSNCSIHKGGMSETFGSMRINLMDGAAGRLYCFSAPKAEEMIAWYDEIKAVIDLRNAGGSDPAANMTGGLRRRFNASGTPVKEFAGGGVGGGGGGLSGGEGDDDDDDDDGLSGSANRASANSTDSGSYSRKRSTSGGNADGRNDQVMNLLRSRGLSHGYGGRKRNKRLQSILKAPLAESVKQLVSLYREADAWQLLGVEDDVRVSLLKPDVAQQRGLAYPTPIDMSMDKKTSSSEGSKIKSARSKRTTKGGGSKRSQQMEDVASGKKGVLPMISGVCIIKAPPSAVSRLIMDPRERGNWDPHFSEAEEVDSCFPRTQIVRLKGRLAWRRSSGPLDEVCQRVAEQGVSYMKTKRGCCGASNGKMGLCGCRDLLLGNSSLLSVLSNATVAAGISGVAAYGAGMLGTDPTVAAVAGAAVAGAACWHSDGQSTKKNGGGSGSVSGTGALGVDNGGRGGGGGRWSVGPLTWDVESRASDRTVLAVQHLCTMGRDSDVILERSVLSNNTEYKGRRGNKNSVRGGKGNKKSSTKTSAVRKLEEYVVGTVGVSGWIIEPLVVRERVVSQVTYVASLDGGGWLPTPLNASLVMERLSCLTCLKALAAQTLDTDSWGAEMDLARRPGDLWEPGAEAFWTDEKIGGSAHENSSGGEASDDGAGGSGVDMDKKVVAGTTMNKASSPDSQESNSWANYQDPSMVVRASGYLDSSSDGYKKKVKSEPAMYECVSIDIFPTEEKVSNLSDYFEKPDAIKEKDGNTSGVPHTFVYNAIMPAYKAAMWGGTEGGRSHNIVAW